MPTQQTSQQFEKFQSWTPEQAHTQIAVLPISMVYEAREALQQVKDSSLSTDEVIGLVEPLGRAIGWAEALVFAYGKTTERDMVRQLLQSGQGG